MRSEQRDLAARTPAHTQGPDRAYQRKLPGNDAVGVARAPALLIVGDLDVVRARLREPVGEANRCRAAVRAEFANHLKIGIEDRDYRLEGATDQHRAILK